MAELEQNIGEMQHKQQIEEYFDRKEDQVLIKKNTKERYQEEKMIAVMEKQKCHQKEYQEQVYVDAIKEQTQELKEKNENKTQCEQQVKHVMEEVHAAAQEQNNENAEKKEAELEYKKIVSNMDAVFEQVKDYHTKVQEYIEQKCENSLNLHRKADQIIENSENKECHEVMDQKVKDTIRKDHIGQITKESHKVKNIISKKHTGEIMKKCQNQEIITGHSTHSEEVTLPFLSKRSNCKNVEERQGSLGHQIEPLTDIINHTGSGRLMRENLGKPISDLTEEANPSMQWPYLRKGEHQEELCGVRKNVTDRKERKFLQGRKDPERMTNLVQGGTNHKKEEETLKKYSCSMCSASFNMRARLYRHLRNPCCKAKDGWYTCANCKESFLRRQDLVTHMHSNHPGVKQSFFCGFCNEYIPFGGSLMSHIHEVHKSKTERPARSAPDQVVDVEVKKSRTPADGTLHVNLEGKVTNSKMGVRLNTTFKQDFVE